MNGLTYLTETISYDLTGCLAVLAGGYTKGEFQILIHKQGCVSFSGRILS